MSDSSQQYLTKDKLEALKNELIELKEEKIPTIAKRIDEARQMGDLSENAEYHSARDEMAWAQTRVKEVENILNNSLLIADSNDDEQVTIGCTVIVKTNKVERSYTIVGAQEAEPLAGKISNESPLGRALIGAKIGDKIEVDIPAGTQIYEIIEIK